MQSINEWKQKLKDTHDNTNCEENTVVNRGEKLLNWVKNANRKISRETYLHAREQKNVEKNVKRNFYLSEYT